MTKNQEVLRAYENSYVLGGIRKKNAGKLAGVDRRLLSYLTTILHRSSTITKQLIREAIQNNEKFVFSNGEITGSLELAAKLVNAGNRIVGHGDTTMVVYLLRCDGKTKIGIAKSISNRIATMQTGNPYIITLLQEYKVNSEQLAREIETALHTKYNAKVLIGEWFDLTDRDILDIDIYIKEYLK